MPLIDVAAATAPQNHAKLLVALGFGATLLVVLALPSASQLPPSALTTTAPAFVVVDGWPKTFPEPLGDISGVHVDDDDNVWIIHRTPNSNLAPVLLLDGESGEALKSWGGPGEGYDWPESEHGLFVDGDTVYLQGGYPFITDPDYQLNHFPPPSKVHDRMVVAFSTDGEFRKQYGKPYTGGGNEDTANFNRPSETQVFDGELYVADGHGNRRLVVLDAATGAFKRKWGAFGRDPDDPRSYDEAVGGAASTWGTVHCVAVAIDGLVYVCDRDGGHIHVFTRAGEFVRQVAVEPAPPSGFANINFNGPWDIAFSRDAAQSRMYVTNGWSGHVSVFDRATVAPLSTFGGKDAGDGAPGTFKFAHSIATDSKGNVYVTEIALGALGCRVQKFRPG